MSSHQLNANSSQGPKNINQNLYSNKYRSLAPKPSVPKVLAPRLTENTQETSVSQLMFKPSAQALPRSTTPALARPNSPESYSLMTRQATPMGKRVNNVEKITKMTLLFNITLTIMHLSLILTILDTRIILLKKMCQWNLEEMNNSKKRKTSDDKFQAWSDEETSKLLDFLEENFDKYQKGKKPEFYAIVSRSIIKTKSAESIKGRLNRLLEKYSKVKRQNNQSGSGRVDWKWMEQMERIFGYCENISPSYISNETTEYIDDETNEDLKVEKDDKKVVKRKKNNVESLIDVMNNISETKAKISEQRLELEMNNDFRLQIEKFEVEKKKWEFEREQSKMLHELTMKKLEFQMKQCNN